jgi:hypothetical protein
MSTKPSPHARCAACGQEAPASIDGKVWVVCDACVAALPVPVRDELFARRHAATVTRLAAIAVAAVTTPTFIAYLFVPVYALVYLCLFLAALTAGHYLDRAERQLHDAVHIATLALNAIRVPVDEPPEVSEQA